jgi:ribose 5-phosphate isomerase B
MNIYAGSDHGGFSLKKQLIRKLTELGHEVVDLGCDSEDSCDYPDFAHAVAAKIQTEPGSMGILTCGSGIGISIAANRHAGIRAALCHNSLEATLARQHNDANILVMGGRLVGEAMAFDILEKFFATSFSGGRHQRRIEKIEVVAERQK